MRKITLQRVDKQTDPTVPSTNAQTYGMTLTVTAAYDMPTEVFVKQRLASDGSQDIFAAVASAEQLDALPVDEPGQDSSFFRSNTVTLWALNQAALDDIASIAQWEIKLLIRNLNALDNEAVPSRTYEITGDSIISD